MKNIFSHRDEYLKLQKTPRLVFETIDGKTW